MMKTLLWKSMTVGVAMAAMMLSCGHGQESAYKLAKADSLISLAYNAADFERVIVLADSLEQTGDISPFKSASLRGISYSQMGDFRHAKEVLRPVMDMEPTNHADSFYYMDCVSCMVQTLNHEHDNEGVLRIALPVIKIINETEGEKHRYFGLMNQIVGTAQLSLGMKKDAATSFDKSYNYMLKQSVVNPMWQTAINPFICTYNIFCNYIEAEDYEGAERWFHRQDSLIGIISKLEDLPAHELDGLVAVNNLAHAMLATAQKNKAELSRAIADYRKTEKSKTVGGLIDEAAILVAAERYAEAADDYAVLDQFFAEGDVEVSLENINNLLKGKFEANYKAGRRDSALAVAAYIFEHLDSAITKQKESDAAELATVYQTQQKDAEIAQQQIELSRQRWIGTLAALILLSTFFIIYAWYRRRAEKRLGEAHVKLQNAYNQLEETTAAKERIESELRIARDIQMSMVPGVFPDRNGLDMHAEMTPAKEVGGDLYGYVYLPAPNGEGMEAACDVLYFCVGDVSGKGVPASLFMAQSARLFRTLATENMMPADIAFRMNNALAENNDRGMFVTMFIGMLHLNTGRLDYCNCGHNAPVIDGQFLKMAYDNQPLGLWEDDPFEGESIEDIRGRQLLIYTDGLNEAENSKHELLGNARLLELMADTQSLDSRQVIAMLKDAVEQHRNGADPNDDLTLMCLKLS